MYNSKVEYILMYNIIHILNIFRNVTIKALISPEYEAITCDVLLDSVLYVLIMVCILN